MANQDAQPFPATSWSLVRRAGVSDSTEARQAMDVLLRRYLPALRARLLRDYRLQSDRVPDLLQGFISDRVLEQRLLLKADRGVGKFRTFLLTALDHYVIDRHRYEAAKCRSAGSGVEPLDELTPAPTRPPADEFDRAWARQVLGETVERMKAECIAAKRDDLWGLFQARVLEPAISGIPPLAYDELVVRFGLRSPDHASNVLMTAKRMFVRTLRAVVGELVEREEDIDEEIHELRAALATAGAGNGRPLRS